MGPVAFMQGVRFMVGLHLSRLRVLYLGALVLFVAVFGVFSALFLMPTAHFPVGTVVTIAPGTSVTRAAYELHEQQVIASPFLFTVLVRLIPDTAGVQSGKYRFERPVGVLVVAWDLAHGISGMPSSKVTFPEGITVKQMADILERQVPDFDAAAFRTAAHPAEGYLFPDTYFIAPEMSATDIVALMRENYDTHLAQFSDDIKRFGESEADVITMASLLEGEGRGLEERRMIAGILWRRIAIGMPLQVDAVFAYLHDETGYTPTAADLRSDSAYNTYRYKGLPPTPINNPGENAIRAALTPLPSDYLYYLTGTDGNMHYAKTYVAHLENQRKYLK